MFRYEEDAEEVIRGEREVKASRAGRKTTLRKAKARTARTAKPKNPLGTDAKNYNDEIPDPDLFIPE
ncbi:MAG: hypothetical protein ACOX5M_03050 [Bacillota bacterium]|jgi:hypothetical protein